MKLFGKDLTRDVVVIAEIGVNHEGSVDVASALVRAAAEAGADAVKFQSYTPERFVGAEDAERLARVTRFGLDEAAHRRLAAEANALGIAFLSAAITEDWIPLLAELSPAIKIASGDLTFEPAIRAAACSGRPVILSTGCSTVDEVDNAVAWVKDEVGAALPERLALMHCVSAYPTPLEQANLHSIPFMAERYGLKVGWSNHVVGAEACIAAVALGAALVEVHVTDRKTGRSFRDHEMSFEPAELAALVSTLSRVRTALGVRDKHRAEAEAAACNAMRKGVVAARDLAPGVPLTRDDLMFARPATEFPAARLNDLIGKMILAPLRRGALVRRDNIKGDALLSPGEK
jgi:N,N'-diacetyllegionaminate synthase